MSKASLIDINKIKAWLINRKLNRFEKKIEAAMAKANWLTELTGYRYMVILFGGKIIVEKRANLKRAIAMRKFKKGVNIQDFDRLSVHNTIVLSKHTDKTNNGERKGKNNGSDTVCRAGKTGE